MNLLQRVAVFVFFNLACSPLVAESPSILASSGEGTENWWLWFLLLGIVLPFVIFLILSILTFYFGKKWIGGYVSPEVSDLSEKLDSLKKKNPDWDDEKLISFLVRKQALKCGMVGALTGFGGFTTMIVTLPVDLIVTARYQSSMVSFIAQVYGYTDSLENKAATYAVMAGTTEVSKITARVVRKYLPRVMQGFFSKLIPVVGAVINFTVNYALAYSTANLAKKWYSSKPKSEVIGELKGV
ncbi:MAG: hypothetical protein AAF518_17975 [Spirochaetota bacterium]